MKSGRAKELFHIWATSKWGKGKKGQSSGRLGGASFNLFVLAPFFCAVLMPKSSFLRPGKLAAHRGMLAMQPRFGQND